MSGFFDLLKKKERTVIGILSGTSIDAIDAVLVRIKGSGLDSRVQVLDFRSFPIAHELKKKIFEVSGKNTGRVDDLCRLNVMLGILYGKCINKFIKLNKISREKIDIIGSHGQTVHHLPIKEEVLGVRSSSTLQIGDPSVIANVTGITTVGDFRIADIAAGGSGAPLVPYLDQILFRSSRSDRLLVNIGGISNVTYLPKKVSGTKVIAFDTGPGNMIIDYVMMKLTGKKFDRNGSMAAKGKVNERLFDFILKADSFYSAKPPKSTGREHYGEEFSERLLRFGKKLPAKDTISTVTKFTAYAIYENVKHLNIDELIVSGGGSKNQSIINELSSYFVRSKVKCLNEKGVNSENKEAVLFALLANEIISGNKANLMSVTGAKRNVYLGKICPA